MHGENSYFAWRKNVNGEVVGMTSYGAPDRAAIVGPEGTGKTTLLEDLAARLAAQGRRIRGLRL